MGNYDVKISVSTKVDTSQMQRLQIQIDKAVNKVDSLTKKYDELKEKQKIPTDSYKNLESSIRKTKFELSALVEEERKLSDKGIGKGLDKEIYTTHEAIKRVKEELATAAQSGNHDYYYEVEDNLLRLKSEMQEMMSQNPRPIGDITSFYKLEETIENTKNKLAQTEAEMQKLVDSGKAFTIGADSSEINKVANDLSLAKSELRMLVTKQQELGAKSSKVSDGLKKISTAAKKSFGEMNGHIRKSSGLLGTFASRLKGIALSLLIFNWITKGFNAMVSGMKAGFKNLVQYSDEYNKSVSSLQSANAQLQNSFAAAFAPIVQMVIPYLVQLIGYVTTAINTVAQFIAILSGKSTLTRATAVQKDYAKSLNGTTSAAKKAAGALAAFDDIDVLNKKDTSGGAGGASPNDMFEEVPVDPKLNDWLDSIISKLKPIADYLKKLGSIFMDGFWDGLGDYEYRLDIIKNGLQTIKDILIDIWTDPSVVEAAQGYIESLVYMLGSLAGSVASIALTLAAAFIGGLADYMENNKERIKNHIISMFNIGTEINNLFAEFFQKIAYIFEAFASEPGIRFVSALIGSIWDAVMGATELILKIGRDILEILITPITENADGFKTALEGMLEAGANVLEGFKAMIDGVFDSMNSVYDMHFKPFFDSIANGVSKLTGEFLEMWNGHVSPILQNLGTKIGELYSQYLGPFFSSVVNLIGNLVTVLKGFWEEMIMPMIEVLISYVFPVVADLFDICITSIINGIENLISFFTFMLDVLNVVVEQWSETWDSAKEVFNSYWEHVKALANLMKDLLTNIFASIKALVNGDWKLAWDNAKKIFSTFKDNVKNIVDSIRTFLKEFFDWIASMVEACIEKIKSIGSAIGNGISGLFGGGDSGAPVPASYSDDVPHLASGAVIRGGNPFMAVLGDQKSGQTNVEAPLSTIEDAVRNVIGERSSGDGSLMLNMNIDGETFARLFLPSILNELDRQGYDIDPLGGLT